MKPKGLLNTQSSSRQRQLWKWLSGDPEKDIPPLLHREVIARIKKAWRLKVSSGQLSGFYAWYPFAQDLHSARTLKEDVAEYLESNPDIDLNSRQVLKVGQIIFEKIAIGKKDVKLYVELCRIRQKDEELRFSREKFEVDTCELFLKWFHDTESARIAQAQMGNAEKIAALRKHFFAEVDALEKSGAVQLPA